MEDVLVSLTRASDLQISPDGRWVAYVADPYSVDPDKPWRPIWIAPTDGSTSARQLTSWSGRDGHPRWSPDGRTLAFLSDREEKGTDALYLIPIDGGEARLALKPARGILDFRWAPDGGRICFRAVDEPSDDEKRRIKERDDPDVFGQRWPFARLSLLDVATGQVARVPTGDGHVTAFACSPDGGSIAFLRAPTPQTEQTGLELLVSDPDAESARLVCPVVRGSFQLDWTSDGQSIFYVGGHEDVPQSSFTVYAVNPSEGRPRVIGPGPADDRCVVSAASIVGERRVLATVAHGLTTRLELIDAATSESEVVFSYPGGDVITATAMHRAAGDPLTIAAVLGSGDQPPELYVGSAADGASLRRVSDHHADVRRFTLGSQESFFWSTRDQLDLDGLIVRPPGHGGEPLPTIVLVHGGPYGRWTAGWNLAPWSWAQLLASHGFLVLLPNCRGGMGHGHRFAVTARGDVGGADYRDLMDAVDAAVERRLADPDRLGIGGWSQGGYLTGWAVTQTRRFRAGVMGAGISDWRGMVMESDLPRFEATLAGGRPWDGPGPHRSDRRSPISFARDVRTPLLILHGKDDPRVPVGQAIGFHRALVEADVPTELVIYPREGHTILEPNHQRDLYRRVLRWFDRWVKG